MTILASPDLSIYQTFHHLNKYSRWREEDKRRETWPETVQRYMDFIIEYLYNRNTPLSSEIYQEVQNAILYMEVLPSMRALMTAGPAAKRDEAAMYNCTAVAIDNPKAFDEILYLSMAGCGCGFSVEKQFISKLPDIPELFYPSDSIIVVPDSKIGWATSFRQLMAMLYSGLIPKWDLSRVRPTGSRLKTMGGKSSGPKPLEDLFQFTIDTFKEAQGRKLNSLECHSIICKIGDIVVVGGVRRTALISLSDLDDYKMRNAKSGEWWNSSPYLALANNSAVYETKPSIEQFTEEWLALMKSGSGERGIFNRWATNQKISTLLIGRREVGTYLTNPCAEINLKSSGQMCNLSQVTVREYDDENSLSEKIRIASIIGTIQSCFTNFRYINSKWKKNCEEERLLGVGMTGIMENSFLNGSGDSEALKQLLLHLKGIAIETNKEIAQALQINPSAAITCIKPAGNSTQLIGGHGSGLHEAYAPFYIRRFRVNKTDPVGQLLYMQDVPCEDDVTHPEETWVFSWPMKAPQGSITRDDRTAIERLEHWLIYAEYFCDHNPSVTISVKPEEWLEVGAWIYKNFDKATGLSFLPFSDHVYQQAPYEQISEEEYEQMLQEIPQEIDWTLLQAIETEDMADNVRDAACVAGSCLI